MAVAATESQSRSVAVQSIPWVPVACFAALVGTLYLPTIYAMAKEWFYLEEMGHGMFVPFIAGYIVWQQREEILRQPIQPTWWGVPLMLLGFLQLLVGRLGADFFVERTSLFVTVAGLIVTCCGVPVLRTLTFPFVICLFMIRIPLIIYSQITFPLQIFASIVAERALSLLNIPVFRDGNILDLASQRLSVVEACSGIRSLISLMFLSLVYAYFFDPKKWMRLVLVVAAVPIAIVANAARVTITGIISEYNKQFSEGTYHTFEGWLIFMVALAILVMAHQLINKVYSAVHER